MEKLTFLFLSVSLLTAFYGGKKWMPLLKKNLSQWGIYLSYPDKSQNIEGLPRDAHEKYTGPIGLNKGKWGVFAVKEENGEPVLHVSGEIYGAVSTKQEFENYHLKGQDMIDACRKNKVQLTIGYRMQHEPNTQQIIKYRREKTFGAVKFVTASTGFRAGWKSAADHWKMDRSKGGSPLYDMGVYSLNAARYSVGEEPIAVLAQDSTKNFTCYPNGDETTLFQLEFPGGATTNCMTTFAMNINSLEVTAADGW